MGFFGFFVMGVMIIISTLFLIVALGVKYEEFRDKKPYRDSDLTGAVIGFIICAVCPLILVLLV
jgi:uncharacterized membrane protein